LEISPEGRHIKFRLANGAGFYDISELVRKAESNQQSARKHSEAANKAS
jgi:hypothetical protein